MMEARLLELYRAAQRLEPEAFGDHAFEWLRVSIPFECSVIVTTYDEHAAWVDARFFGIDDPRALMEGHARVRHLDLLTTRMLRRPMVAMRQDGDAPALAGKRFAPYREHLRRFSGWRNLSIRIPSADHHTSTVVIVCRGEDGQRFTKADAKTFESITPHVAEAAAVNRSIWLPRSAGPESGGLPVALLDAEGRFVQTSPSFVRLFWPTAPPRTAYLDKRALHALQKRQPWPLAGGKHTLYGVPEDTGGFRLRIRATSALDQLSARERQVAALFARGASYKVIAEQLGLAPATARNHLQNLYSKLGVGQRAELVALVAEL